MASVYIYPAHKPLLDKLIATSKPKSAAAGTKTGPFRDMRDAYVFAASLALALNQPTPPEEMPAIRKDSVEIQERVFMRAEGAHELAAAVVLTRAAVGDVEIETLRAELDMLSNEKLSERFALLDRFAHAGFEWLSEHQKDESGVRDLILSAIDSVECVQRQVDDDSTVKDPLWSMLSGLGSETL